MTSRELLDKTIAMEPTPRVPFALLDGHAWVRRLNDLSPNGVLDLPDAGAAILADAYRQAGSDLLFAGTETGFFAISAMGGQVDDDVKNGASEILTRPLTEPSDIDKFDLDKTLAVMRQSRGYLRNLEQVRNLRALVGGEYHIAVGGFGAFTIASQMIGVEEFLMALMEDEDGNPEKMIRFAAELLTAFYRDMLAAGGDAVFLCEPVASGDLISQSMFQDYVLPINREMTERLRPYCDFVLMHICGNTAARVAPVAETGVAIFSVDSIDMTKALEDAGGRMVVMGNLSPSAVLLGMDAQGVARESAALCQSLAGKPGFILGPGCDLAPQTAMENVQAMAKAVR